MNIDDASSDSMNDGAEAAATVVPAPMVGRMTEVAALSDAASRVKNAGRPQVVVIRGPAGIGKSRLVQEFLVTIQWSSEPFRLVHATARGETSSYGLVSRLLRSRFGLSQDMEPFNSRAAILRVVSEVLGSDDVDDVAHFLGQFVGVEFEGGLLARALRDDAREAGAMRATVLRRFLTADSALGKVCWILEDLHEANADTLAMLKSLLDHLDGPVLVLCVARDESAPVVDAWVAGDPSRYSVLDLPILTQAESEQLMTALLSPCGESGALLVGAGSHLANGNPLQLEQIVRIFHDAGVIEVDATQLLWTVHPERLGSLRLPSTVQEAVQARISSLSLPLRGLLERAATVGNVFWLGALIVLERCERSAPEFWDAGDDRDERLVRERLHELRDKDFILLLPDSTFPGDEEYVFKQSLERERLVQLTSPSASRRYHRVVADWLEQQSEVREQEEHLSMLATHRELAGTSIDAALAFLDAGQVARNHYAPLRAVEYLSKGLRLLGEECVARRLGALHELGDVCQQLGRMEESVSAFREMLDLAFRHNLKGKGGAAHNRIGRVYREIGELDVAGRHLQIALDLFEDCKDVRGVASSLDDIGKLYWLRGDYPRALENMRKALRMRREFGDRRSIALSLHNAGLVMQDSGEFELAFGAFEQALKIRREIGDRIGVITTLLSLGAVTQAKGDVPKALAMFEEALEMSRRIGDKGHQAQVLTQLGAAHRRMGARSRAIELLIDATSLHNDVSDKLGLAESLRELGICYLEINELVKARESILRSVDILAESRNKVRLGRALRTLGEITAAGGWGASHISKSFDYWERSIAIFEDIGNDLELAHSLKSYADALSQAQSPEASAQTKLNAMRERADKIFARLRPNSIPPIDPLSES